MNVQAAKLFSKVILSENKLRIKLLGDSITHGVGGSGFKQDGVRINEQFARNPNGYCWAKLFKEHMESQFNCEVINNGCTGTSIQYVISHFNELVDPEDDIIICTIGTNDRHQYLKDAPMRSREKQMERFYGHLMQLWQTFVDAGKADKVIFMANIPASANNEKDNLTCEKPYVRFFHMNDLCDMYTKASLELGFPLIRMYALFLGYCEDRGIAVESLLADGLHPNDNGYRVMFKLITEELGVARGVISV